MQWREKKREEKKEKKKLGEGARKKGMQKPASCPWNVSFGMLEELSFVKGCPPEQQEERDAVRTGRAALLRELCSGWEVYRQKQT